MRLAAIVESSDDAIVAKDLNGYITSWNRSAERIFGYSANEAIGQHITMIIPAERRAEEDYVLSQVRQGQPVDHFETIRVRKDGTRIPVSLTVSPVRDARGTIVGASKIARDLTQRARMEAALVALVEASSALQATPTVAAVVSATLHVATKHLPADGVAIWRFDYGRGAWIPSGSSGISPGFAERVVAARSDWQAPDDIPFAEPIVAEDVGAEPQLAGLADAYRREGIASMLVLPLRIAERQSGTLVFYYRTRRTFQTVDVQIALALANLVSTALTTAELYDTQRGLREAAEHANQQAEFLADAGATLARSLDYENTLVTVANLAVPRLADWCAVDITDDEGVLRRLAVAHVNPDRAAFARDVFERYPAGAGSPYTVEHAARAGQPILMEDLPDELLVQGARDGEHLRLLRGLGLRSYVIVPLIAATGPFGAMTFASSESGRRFRRADLQFFQSVAYRVALAVENARAYRRVREANRLKDEFLATLSHELRTPLNSVLGYVRLLRMGALDGDRSARALEVIERNAQSLHQMIEDVLDVSRIISGRMRLDLQPVDLRTVVNDAAATVLPAAEARGVRFTLALDVEPPRLNGDPARLQQVVWNLLSNAVKFTDRGGRVDVRIDTTPGGVEVVVADTGRGIPPEFLPHMFERFRQADSRLAREFGGLGLGLAIARHITEMHGGTIEAESEGVGRGSTFRMRLPHVAGPAERLPSPPSAPVRPVATLASATRLNGVRLLVVDDDEDALRLLRTVLETAGAEVRAAASAPEALRLIQIDPPDVLVADVGMPGMDGLDLIRQIRALDEDAARSVPAAALTAYARAQDRTSALDSGFQAHLPKPFDPIELVEVVATLAGRRS